MGRAVVPRGILATIGVIAVGLGAVGVFVPLLPTTPFLLLAASCFLRSSDRLYTWLVHHRLFGSFVRNLHEHRGMTASAKAVSLVLLWSVIGCSATVAVQGWRVRGVLLLIAAGVTIHVLQLKTIGCDTGKLPRGLCE